MMTALGTLHPTRDGGWTGPIFILAHDVKIKLVPNDNQTNPKAPAFRIFSGDAEVGAAWRKQRSEKELQDFLSGDIDFPGLAEPISVAFFFADDGTKARVMWNRRN